MNTRLQILCAWCGVISTFAFFVGWWPAAGFFPPHEPSADANEILTFYFQNPNGIRTGAILFIIAGGLYVPFSAALATQIRRMEGHDNPVLAYTALGTGAATSILYIAIGLLWGVATYRPDRDPQITQLLNDLAWFLIFQPVVLFEIQCIAIGIAILIDKSPRRVFPRWLAYFSFWVALMNLPDYLLSFFYHGPFAWNGLFAFWIPAIIYFPWFILVVIYVIKAAKEQELANSTEGDRASAYRAAAAQERA